MLKNQNSLKGRQNRKKFISAWVLLLPTVILLYLFIWRPSVTGIVWSFFKMKGFTPTEFIGLENYVRVVTNTEFLPILWNTVQYVFWSLLIGFPLPILIAFALNEMVFFKTSLRSAIYTPALMPGITIMLLWSFIYAPDTAGLLNQILNLFGIEPYVWLNDSNWVILYIIIEATWAAFPSTMLYFYTNIQSISADLYEAATIDGAGFFARFRHVALPSMASVILLNLVNQIINVFQIMQQPMVMTGGGPNGASMSVGYQIYKYAFEQGRVGQALALGTITFVILIFATIFYFKMQKKAEENLG